MKRAAIAVFAVLLTLISPLRAQIGEAPPYGSKNTFSAVVEYANDSSHIILGRAPNRKFTALGIQYERRLLSNHFLTLRYAAEFRPLIFVRDITEDETFTITEGPIIASGTNPPIAVTQCVPQTEVLLITTIQITCSHRWSYAQGLSPFGARMNLRPNRRLQPTASLLAGYILSSQKTPIDAAGSFNFSFEIGAGLEYFLSPKTLHAGRIPAPALLQRLYRPSEPRRRQRPLQAQLHLRQITPTPTPRSSR